ncbi:MAG TPA: YidC/Oxa1 family membrane protein insertase [bacterium]
MDALNGLLSGIADALHDVLRFFYGFAHDYTLAIILLTLVVKLALHPLTRTQLRSMKGMQVIAPHMEALRRKYKDDPKALNQEMMALYRAHNLNPMMGCLPMLVQMPVFIALWRLLYTKGLFGTAAVFGIPWMRLDQAPNLGQVLSAVAAGHPEQLLLLLYPVLVGATMYFQQRMTITDPSQARMFVFMPIMMGYFATIYPIGVSIYMIVSTMAYIAEYFLVVGSPPPSSGAPPKSQAAAAASSASGGRAPAPMPQGKKGAKRA